MDLATIIGLIVGSVFVLLGIITLQFEVANINLFLDPPSMMIVGGGTIGSVMICCPMKQLMTTLSVLRHSFFYREHTPLNVITKMVEFAEIARRDGILALEGATEDTENEFMVKGIQLAVDGTDPELIEQIMSNELENIEERHKVGRKIFDNAAAYGPAWGMIGTLIGLIQMLANLNDPETIGPKMAVALVTTFYGAVFANFIAGPVSKKLQKRSDEEALMKEIIVRGVMSIQSGDNPRIVDQKLRIFLPPNVRKVAEYKR